MDGASDSIHPRAPPLSSLPSLLPLGSGSGSRAYGCSTSKREERGLVSSVDASPSNGLRHILAGRTPANTLGLLYDTRTVQGRSPPTGPAAREASTFVEKATNYTAFSTLDEPASAAARTSPPPSQPRSPRAKPTRQRQLLPRSYGAYSLQPGWPREGADSPGCWRCQRICSTVRTLAQMRRSWA